MLVREPGGPGMSCAVLVQLGESPGDRAQALAIRAASAWHAHRFRRALGARVRALLVGGRVRA